MTHFTTIPNSSPVNANVFNSRFQEVSDDIDDLLNGGALPSLNLGTPTTLTIAGGSITKLYSRHLIDTEAGASEDDLTTIVVGVEGDVLEISCVSASRAVIVKHNTGNVYLSTQADLRLDNPYRILRLTYLNGKWAEARAIVTRASTVATGVRVPDDRTVSLQSQGWAEQHWGGRASNTLMQPDGTAAPTVTGTASAANDTDSVYVNYATGAVATNPAGIYSPTFNFTRRQHNPKFWWLMRTGAAAANADITAVRMWLGLFSALPTTVSSLAGATEAAAIRYDTVAGDTSFMPVCKDATTQSVGAGLIAVTAGTKYLFCIEIDDANGRVLFSVNNGSPIIMTSNLPAAATELGFAFQIFTTAAAAKNFKLSRYFCRAN